MIDTSSHGSSDSGYGTMTPSVASPTPQPSYSTQSYPVQKSSFQNYSTQSCFPSQQSPTYTYNAPRNPSIEVVQTAPVSSSKHAKKRRLRYDTVPICLCNPAKKPWIAFHVFRKMAQIILWLIIISSPLSPSTPSEYPCPHPDCGHISSRTHDLKGHMTVHFPPKEDELLDCKFESCGRTGAYGFKREDHRKEHYRKVHKETEYPKTRKGGRSGRESGGSPRTWPPARRSSPAANETHPEPGILQPLHDPEARVESERARPIEAEMDENESFVALMPQPSTEDKLAAIISQVLKTLVTNEVGQYCASLKLQWDILGFIEDQFRDIDSPNTALGRVITISGSARHAQAATCSGYIQQNWPTYGSKILDALQDALDSVAHSYKSSFDTSVVNGSVPCDKELFPDTKVEIDITQGFLFLDIKSEAPDIIVDIFQQLTWMGAALRTSRDGGVQYCEPKLERDPRDRETDSALFNVTFDLRSPVEEDRSCWFPLFTNPVIAFGFSTALRNDSEVGLEIPLEMMAALGGARHVVDFEGGLVMKGHSAMFVPLKRYDQSIQWHLIRRSDEQRIRYREVSNECPNRAMLEEVDHETLSNTRVFLGWWPSSETHLGTADAAYNSIDWSPAGDAKRATRFSGASIGFQTMVTGQLSFAPGAKDGRLHFSQKGPFQKVVQLAQKTPVLLYDPTDRRAWCVPGLELMLHIVQTRHHLSPYNIDGEEVELTPVMPENGRGAAVEAVRANQMRMLYARSTASEKTHYFQDEILDIWSRMERLMDEKDSLEASPGLTLHGTMQSKLHGWEYMSLVNEKNYNRKEAKVAKSSGGWVDLFNDIDALVLFATGFDDIIKPVSDLSNLCRPWRTLPKGKDYLAVGVPILEMLYTEAGSHLSRKHLSSNRHQWHRGSVLFEHCSNTTSCRCECDRTQQIYHESPFKTFGHVKPPGSLEENGCVVFGQAYHPFKPPPTKARSQNSIRSLVNLSARSSRNTMRSSANDKHSTLPSPPPSVSPESGETGDDVTWGRERPSSPVRITDDIAQEKDVVRGRMIPHERMPNLEKRRKLDNGGDRDDCATNTLEYHPMLGHDEISNGQDLGCTAIAGGSKAGCLPLDGRKTIRHKAKIEDFSYRPGFSFETGSTMDIGPPESVERVEIINSTQRNVK